MIPLHPVFLATYLWVSSYALNQNELFFRDVANAGVAITATAVLLVAVIWLVTRNRSGAGVIALLAIIMLAYYGHVYDTVRDRVPESLFMLLWGGLFLTPAVLIVIKRLQFEGLTKILNAVTLMLVLVPLGSLVIGNFNLEQKNEVSARPASLILPAVAGDPLEYPDIYYLIFDRYADNRTLQADFGFDNQAFLGYLRRSGFFVADRSRANYLKTSHSLVSSLNLSHLLFLSERVGPGSNDWKVLYELLNENEVAHFLKARGYRYAHLGSWWQPTRSNSLADENFDATALSPWVDVNLTEFEWLLADQSLPIRLANLTSKDAMEKRRRQFHRVQKKFDKLASLRRQDAPLFVFAHMLLPHTPFVFHSDGRLKSLKEEAKKTRVENYIDQLVHANRRIEDLVAELLSREPQPVIIIQADEGPHPPRYLQDLNGFDWRNASDQELQQKFRILNAIYFPDHDYRDLYDDITPVNTFRIVFNKYFGMALPLVSDQSFTFNSASDIYSFVDVTDATR